jgi:putative transposase
MWAMDFMHDTLFCGKRFRTLNIIDEGAREALAIEVDSSLSAERVVRVLDQIGESRPLPDQIRIDNGPELYSAKVVAWAEAHSVRLHYIVHEWMTTYNEERPHEALGNVPPRIFSQQQARIKTEPMPAPDSTYELFR